MVKNFSINKHPLIGVYSYKEAAILFASGKILVKWF